jgi:dinuclear metal center YbgI/SA1388 family protein
MKIQDVINRIETYAPLHFQESYDNSGIQVGNSSMEVKGILLTIDITEEVLEEAVIKGCNLVIAHHPLLFLSQKKITGSNYIQRCIIFAIKHDITIYASHTNMDKVRKGVSWKMAEKINLKRCKPLAIENEYRLKIGNFCTNQTNRTSCKCFIQSGAQASSAITAVAVIVLQDLAVLKHQTSVTRSVVT